MRNTFNKQFRFSIAFLFAISFMAFNGCSKTENLQLTCSVASVTADAAVIHSTLNPAKQGVGIQLTVTANDSIVQQFNRMHNGTTDFNIANLNAYTNYTVELKVINDPSLKVDPCTSSFTTTLSNTPLVTTSSISNITSSGAVVTADVTYQGLLPVVLRGVCWSTSANPVYYNSHVSSGTGLGSFIGIVSGLAPATKYHIRSYAASNAGYGYSADSTFTTLP